MKKVFIFEILHHHECIELPFLACKESQEIHPKLFISSFVNDRLSQPFTSGQDVTIYDSQFRSRHIQSQEKGMLVRTYLYMRNLLELARMQVSFIAHVFKEKPDVVYINTPHSPSMFFIHLYIIFHWRPQVVSVIHWASMRGINKATFPIYARSDVHAFVAPYVKYKNPYLAGKPRIDITNRPIKHSPESAPQEPFLFLLAGKYEPERKDYVTIAESFARLDKDVRAQVKLVFLSRENTHMKELVERFGLEDIAVMYGSYISDSAYTNIFSSGFFSFITSKDGFYGTVRMSGAYGDSLAYGVPMFVSDTYAPTYKMSGCVRYNKDTLTSLVTQYVKNPETRGSKRQELEVERKKYSLDSIVREFEQVL